MMIKGINKALYCTKREGCQAMRRELMSHQKNILVVKDFSRRNSRGLVELEDLRDAGVRIHLYNRGRNEIVISAPFYSPEPRSR